MPLPTVTDTTFATTAASATKAYVKAGATPTATELVPLASNIDISPAGSSENIPTYGAAGAGVSIKTGLDVSGTIETIATSDDPVVASLVTAGFATGDGAEMFAIFELAEGGYISGIITIVTAKPLTPVRGAARWSFAWASARPMTWTAPV
jgi:hypothetical protein